MCPVRSVTYVSGRSSEFSFQRLAEIPICTFEPLSHQESVNGCGCCKNSHSRSSQKFHPDVLDFGRYFLSLGWDRSFKRGVFQPPRLFATVVHSSRESRKLDSSACRCRQLSRATRSAFLLSNVFFGRYSRLRPLMTKDVLSSEYISCTP